jgi:hypothetical protein
MDNEDMFREMIADIKMAYRELDMAHEDFYDALDTIQWYEKRLPAIEANLIGFASK